MITVIFNMRRGVVFAVFYALVGVVVEFFNKPDSVQRLVRERNNNIIEQLSISITIKLSENV